MQYKAAGLALAVMLQGTMAQAAGLGQVRVESYLNDPLEAWVALTDTRGVDLDDIHVSLADPGAYERAGIERAAFLESLRFEVQARGGEHRILVRSDTPVSEPFVDLLLHVQLPDGGGISSTTLLIDPPMYAVSAQGQVALPGQSGSGPVPSPRPSSAPESVPYAGSYQVQRGDTLWDVAGAVAPDAGLSQPEAALFLHDNNQQAFINGDINRLKASATLMLPARGHSEAYQAEDALDQFLDRANGKAGPRPPASVVSTSPVQARDVEPGTPEASFPDLAPAISPEAYRQADVPVQDRLRVEGVDEVEAGSEVALPSGESPGEDPSVEALNQALQAAEATNRALEERIANLESQIKVMLADNSSGQGAVPPSGSPVSIDAEAMASTVDRDNEVQSSILAMLKNMMMPLLIGLGGLALLVLAVLLRRRGKKPSDGLAGLSVRAPEKVTEANDDENIQGDVEDGLASFDDVPAGASARRRVGIKADARTPDIHADDKAEPADRATVARSPVTEGRRPVAPRTPPLPPVEETPTPVPVVPTDDVMLDQDLAEDRTGAEPSRQAEEQVDEATRTTGTIETVAGEAAIADTGAVETSPEVRAEQSRDPVSDAEVYLSFGQMGNARKLLEQTLESNPDDERVRARLMELLVSCERVEDARVHYDRLRGSGDADIQERCAALKEAFGDFEVQHHADLSGEPPVESPANQPPIDVSLSEADDSLQGLENHLPEEISLDAEDGPVAPVDAETTSGEDHRAKPLVFEEDSELGVAIATSEGEPLRDSVDNESLQHLFDDLGLDDNKNVTASPAESETPAELAPDPDLELPDTDVSAIAGNDTATTKLDLASAYIDMGDLESAREMLEEVLEEGNESQKARARSLLDNFGD